MDGLGEGAREFQIRLAGLAPDQIRIRCVSQPAADRLIQSVAGLEEPFDRTLPGGEWLIVGIHIAGDQIGRFGIGACDQQRRYAQHIGRQTRGIQLSIASRVGTSTLPPMWPHFFTDAS